MCRIRTGDASLATKRIASILTRRIWLRRLDSNQRMTRSKALCLTAWLRLNGGKDRNLTYDRRVAACRLFSWLLSHEWLGWLDSNQRSSGPEPDALPLGHIPMIMTAPRLPPPFRHLKEVFRYWSSIIGALFSFGGRYRARTCAPLGLTV